MLSTKRGTSFLPALLSLSCLASSTQLTKAEPEAGAQAMVQARQDARAKSDTEKKIAVQPWQDARVELDAGVEADIEAMGETQGGDRDGAIVCGPSLKPYVRSCSCPGLSGDGITLACGPGSESECFKYPDTCVDPGFLRCEEANYAIDPSLRGRCYAFCQMVRQQEGN